MVEVNPDAAGVNPTLALVDANTDLGTQPKLDRDSPEAGRSQPNSGRHRPKECQNETTFGRSQSNVGRNKPNCGQNQPNCQFWMSKKNSFTPV